jgi:xyloglucan-specific exo-beta-1,4-glucanase
MLDFKVKCGMQGLNPLDYQRHVRPADYLPTDKYWCQNRRKMKLLWSLCLLFTVWINTEICASTFGTVTMGGGGYVDGIISCPTQTNLFYCKTDVGGAYRWDEPTQSWIPLLDWCSESQTTYQGVESLAIDPQSPNKLYILAGTSYWNNGATAILRSSDYGATFAITDVTAKFKANGNGSNRQKGETLAVDPNNGTILFCGSRMNGLFKSTDSGVTWNAVASLNANLNVASDSISFVKFDPTTGTPGNATQRIFVGVFRTNANFFVSNDGGTNWSALAGSPTSVMPQRCALASNSQLYITYLNGTADGAVMKYNTTNGVWFNCTPSTLKPYCGISVCATNPQKLVASTYSIYDHQPWGSYGDLIYVSTNGGTNWVDIFTSNKAAFDSNGFPWMTGQINWGGALEMDPFNSDRVFIGSGDGLFCTTNLNSGLTTSTWKFMVKGLEETVAINFLSILGGPFLTSIGDYGGFISTDITVSPATGNISQSTSFAYAAIKTNFIARVENNGEAYYSKQLPINWTKFPSTPGVMMNGYLAISPDASTVLWKSTSCYVTTNLGINWTASTGLTFNCIPEADPVNSSKFYAYNSSDGFLYASINGGLNFAKSGSAGTGGSSTFCTAPGFEGHIWIALNNSGLKYSTNSGALFKSGNVSVCNALAFGKSAPGASYPTLYIWGKPTSGSVSGMYRSTDQGVTWVRINDDAHVYGGRGNAGIIEGDKNVYGRVYMSTVGRGVPYMDSSVNVTNLTMSPTLFSTYITGTQQLAAAVLPANASYPSVIWASSNAAVATVSASGLVTANAAGTTTVTATTVDGGFIAGSVVTVTNLLTSPILAFVQGGDSSMTLSWPADHRGWLLQVQTNSLDTGLGTNWVTVPGSDTTNQMIILPDVLSGAVFYRLISP